MRTALISVYDKTGITEFAKGLISLEFKILASGGTAKYLKDAGVPVENVANLVGGEAILGHRVVTLSREIHAGLLAKDNDTDREELHRLKIPWIDLVCVDLYPLEEEIAKHTPSASGTSPFAGRGRDAVIEKTDIGGPALLRAAAKGRRVTICDAGDREKVLEWLKNGEPDREEFLNKLAAKAEEVVSRYCAISAAYHSGGLYTSIFGKRITELVYGENAYQSPAFLYRLHDGGNDPLAIVNWQLLEGSPLSYNNICDLDRMLQTMTHIAAGLEKNFPPEADQPQAGGVPFIAIGAKHGNACGAGLDENEIEAVDKMLLGDLRAIFGGSVMLNFPVDEKIAEELIHKFSGEGQRRLLDIVAAPSFTPEAVEILARKKGKCRLLANPAIEQAGMSALDVARRFRYVRGGFLEQPNYTFLPEIKNKDAILAWAVGSTSNSNTITIVKDGRLYGNGVGQQDRVGAAKLAIFRADEAAKFASESLKLSPEEKRANLEEAVAYSDSFFPFPDAVEVLINRGIKTIFSTSGSVNDEKIKALCATKGVNLILLPDTETRGFYQH